MIICFILVLLLTKTTRTTTTTEYTILEDGEGPKHRNFSCMQLDAPNQQLQAFLKFSIIFKRVGVLTAQNPPIFTAGTKVRGGHREEANVGLLLTQTPKKTAFADSIVFHAKMSWIFW